MPALTLSDTGVYVSGMYKRGQANTIGSFKYFK